MTEENNNSVPTAELASLKLDTSVETPASNGTPVSSPLPANGESGATFKDQFKAFSKFGDLKSDGKFITLSQSDKWMKQAKVIDKKITTTDTGIHFKKLKNLKLSIIDYTKFLEDLSKTRTVDMAEMKSKLTNCGAPGVLQAKSNAKAADTVARLTDTSKYTGSHKQRFDDTGKGKGIAGRREDAGGSGYVSGYKHDNTYDKTH
ncbi:unnamed protein product [Diamesa serratosioi]